MESIALVPFIIAIVQVVKTAGLSSRYAPLLSVALGIAFGTGMGQFNFDGIIHGIAIGLSASGLWSGGKAMLNTDKYI